MPTPSEQKALAFVAIVVLLGGAVRVLKAGTAVEPTAAEQQALARQATAADSAAARGKTDRKTRRPRGSRSRADTIPNVVGGVSSVPPSFARPALPFARSPYGFPPAGPRIDVGIAPAPAAAPPPATRGKHSADTAHINIDAASAEVIERLPRIGPATARRIVANRDSFGPFKSVEGLKRVKGMGPATLAQILPFLTFGPR